MKVSEAIWKRRSIRRFKQKEIKEKKMMKCIDAARLAPSAGNRQPLEYVIVREDGARRKIFEGIQWAGYLEWSPKEGEAPMVYVVVLKNSEVLGDGKYDVGLAIENMILCGMEEGISSCIIASFNKQRVRKILSIPIHMRIELVVAFGYSAEESVSEEMEDSIKYYRMNDVLHVPKRRLEDIVYFERFREKH